MTKLTFPEKIEKILIAASLENQVAKISGMTLRQIAESCDRYITIGKAKMDRYDMTSFIASLTTDMKRAVPTASQNQINTLAISTARVLRDNTEVATFSDFERVIEGAYDKISSGYNTKVNIKADDDLSDLHEEIHADENQQATNSMVPLKDTTFKKWGDYQLIESIIDGAGFMPVLISGLSGNGKSVSIEQACANLEREYIRLQITPETDESDLLGGFRLVGGETVFEKGPVIRAMESGAILCIDEIDRGSNRLMALQGVMEGKPVLLKKTGEIVKPAKGFNVIATANTKGQGDDTGKFSAATILDEAFLERFTMVIEQKFAPAEVEMQILAAHMIKFKGTRSRQILRDLVRWAEKTRINFAKNSSDEYISTRRLCHILQIHSVVNDIKRAVELGVSRYDENTKKSLMESFALL